MTEKKNYPEEIYKDFPTCGSEQGNIAAHMAGRQHAYDLGYRDGRFKERLEASNPLAGWSNLTEAIAAGERIDWEQLEGIEAKCVHPELGTLTYRLERDNVCSSTMPSGWYMNKSANVWKQAVSDGWYGLQGWSLWVKGDLPLRKQTADELEPGTCFRARYKKNGETHNYAWAQLLKPSGQTPRVIFFSLALTTLFGSALPEDVEVVEVYGPGTFEKPEVDA